MVLDLAANRRLEVLEGAAAQIWTVDQDGVVCLVVVWLEGWSAGIAGTRIFFDKLATTFTHARAVWVIYRRGARQSSDWSPEMPFRSILVLKFFCGSRCLISENEKDN